MDISMAESIVSSSLGLPISYMRSGAVFCQVRGKALGRAPFGLLQDFGEALDIGPVLRSSIHSLPMIGGLGGYVPTRTKNSTAIAPGVAALALLVAAIWGFNFVVIKVGVSGMPPLLLAGLRFVLSVVPAIFFVRKPAVSWGRLAAYGLLLGVGEFGFLFTAIKLGAPAGLASIALQAQAFMTAILAAILFRERIRAKTWVGLIFAAGGLVLLALPESGGAASMSPLLGAMVLLAALFWAGANLVARSMPGTDALGLMVWSSIFSPLPLFALSLAFEGWPAIGAALGGIAPITIASLLYLAFLSTLVGYGIWNFLIMRHGATKVAPFSLLVPVFSLSSSAIFLGERFTARDGLAAALVLGGLVVHTFGPSGGKGAIRSPGPTESPR